MSNSKLDKLIKEADKMYGEGTIMRASDYPDLPRLSTGIIGLDMIFGGGLPRGRLAIYAGNESTAKTASALHTIAEAQKLCVHCMSEIEDGVCPECGEKNTEPHKAVFVDIEGTFDPVWAKNIGVNLDDLLVTQPGYSEEAVDLVEALIRTGEVDVLAVDSIAMMTPTEEIEKSAEKQIMGTHAKLNNRMFRSIQAALNSLGMKTERKPVVIVINQVREDIGTSFGNPIVLPGGKGQKFSASIIAKFYAASSNVIYEKGGQKNAVGQRVRVKTTKNKTYPPHKEGYFDLYTDDTEEYGMKKGQVDNIKALAETADNMNMLERAGSWYSYEYDGGEVKGQGMTNFGQELAGNEEALAQLEEQVRTAIYNRDTTF